MAIFPDAGVNGGDLPASLNTGWVWVELNAVGLTVPPMYWYAMNTANYCKSSNGTSGFNATNPTPKNLQKFANAGQSRQVWSGQSGFHWYGMNFAGLTLGYLTTTGISTSTTGTASGNAPVRWGWSWNNETNIGSNDSFGGIGMAYGNYSAGDLAWVETIGINRTMRVEWYVR